MGVRATVNYHVISDQFQAFEFDANGVAGNLISPELVPTEVDVEDIRGATSSVDFDRDGITITRAPSAIKSFEDDRKWRDQYDQEISHVLKRKIGAAEVIIFDHTVRIDDPNAIRKPARNVHNDYSARGANQPLIDLLGRERADEFQAGRYAFVNIWRPIENPILSSPLGFIRPSTMNAGDWMDIALNYPDRKGEILGVAANPKPPIPERVSRRALSSNTSNRRFNKETQFFVRENYDKDYFINRRNRRYWF